MTDMRMNNTMMMSEVETMQKQIKDIQKHLKYSIENSDTCKQFQKYIEMKLNEL